MIVFRVDVRFDKHDTSNDFFWGLSNKSHPRSLRKWLRQIFSYKSLMRDNVFVSFGFLFSKFKVELNRISPKIWSKYKEFCGKIRLTSFVNFNFCFIYIWKRVIRSTYHNSFSYLEVNIEDTQLSLGQSTDFDCIVLNLP